MSGDESLPTVPEERLDGWVRTEAFTETVFQLSAVSVDGHTAVYEDDDLVQVAPFARGGTPHSIEECLDDLEAGRAPIPDRTVTISTAD